MSAEPAGPGRGLALGLAIALAGAAGASTACSGKKREPVSDKGDAPAMRDAGASSDAAAKPDAAEASARPAWQRQSAPLELDCGPDPGKAVAKRASKAAAAVRSLPRAERISICQDQATVELACECLAKAAAADGEPIGTCKATELEPSAGQPRAKSERGRLMSLWSSSSSSATDSGESVVLLARRGKTWSPLLSVASADEVDRDETPRTTTTASVLRYEELPFGDATLFWVQTTSETSDVAAGDRFVQGTAALTLCAVPGEGAIGDPWCAQLPLGEWDYHSSPEGDCAVRKLLTYRVTLDGKGEGEVVLEHGADAQKQAGRFGL